MKLFTVWLNDYGQPSVQLTVAAESADVAMEEALRKTEVQKLLEKSNGVEIRCHPSRGHVLATDVQQGSKVCAIEPEPEAEPAPSGLPSAEEVRAACKQFQKIVRAFMTAE
jgi:hypothetical protein